VNFKPFQQISAVGLLSLSLLGGIGNFTASAESVKPPPLPTCQNGTINRNVLISKDSRCRSGRVTILAYKFPIIRNGKKIIIGRTEAVLEFVGKDGVVVFGNEKEEALMRRLRFLALGGQKLPTSGDFTNTSVHTYSVWVGRKTMKKMEALEKNLAAENLMDFLGTREIKGTKVPNGTLNTQTNRLIQFLKSGKFPSTGAFGYRGNVIVDLLTR
jgi:hypothetical protein